MIGEKWNRAEEKLFEEALVIFGKEGDPDRWQKIADHVPGRSPEEVRDHYDALLYDVSEIDSGRVDLPSYSDDSLGWVSADSNSTRSSQISFGSNGGKLKHSEIERKKGTPWTEDEHRRFLIGLEMYGKGDWRSISRNVVITRTPTQVASHAQKYFLRQNSGKKERKRSSIHDITTTDDNTTARAVVEQNLISAPGGNPIPQHATLQPLGTSHQFSNTQGGASFEHQNFGFRM